MGNHVGKEGKVKIGSDAIAEVKDWSIETSGDVVDNSSINSLQSNSDWRTFKATTKSWNGSLNCWWDESDTNGQQSLDVGSEVTLNLYPEGDTSGDIYFTGTAIITGLNRSASLDGLVEANFTFQGSGALTESTVGA